MGEIRCEWPSADQLARPRKRRRTRIGEASDVGWQYEPQSAGEEQHGRTDVTRAGVGGHQGAAEGTSTLSDELQDHQVTAQFGHDFACPLSPDSPGNPLDLDKSPTPSTSSDRQNPSADLLRFVRINAVHSQPPELGSLSRSGIANRRIHGTDAGRPGVVTQHDGSVGAVSDAPVVLVNGINVEALASAATWDDHLVEFGPFSTPPLDNEYLPTAYQALTSAFPSAFALQLFHHFFNSTSKILITMGNIGPNPLLTLCTNGRLLDTACAGSAALRMSILSTSTAHLINEAEQGPTGGLSCSIAGWNTLKKSLERLGESFRKAALANIVLSDNDGSDQFDSILATCVLLMIRDVISAGPAWQENMDYAIQLVSKRGGAMAVISEDRENFTRRFLIENLLVHDIFSCFVTNREPALLVKFDPWWFECQETSRTRWEWESVERTFGVSRGMVDLLARVVSLHAQKHRLGLDFRHRTAHTDKIEKHLKAQADSLLLELDVWCNGLNGVPRSARVSCGDLLYRYMVIAYILGEILDKASTTPRIIASIDHCLELCSEASAMRMTVMLVWPLLVCGTLCLPPVREKVTGLFDAFAWDYCDDLKAARRIMFEQWDQIDNHGGKQSWANLMKKLDLNVLLI